MHSFELCKKVELHIHLEGAASPSFVREICQRYGRKIPEIFDKNWNYNWQNFDQFLRIYEIVTNLFLEEKNFEWLVRHVLDKQVKENVIYNEIFLGPHLWSDRPSDQWESFLNIAKKVADEYQKRHGIYTYFIIVCIRHLGPEKALEAAKFASKVKTKNVVGFGMAGDEKEFNTLDFEESFNFARDSGLGITTHAGEICGAKSVDEAIQLGVTRIGHGVKSRESEETIVKLLEKNILLELCPGSNIALGLYPSLDEHPINFFFNKNLPISISTDDPPFFSTTLSKEYQDLHNAFGWGYEMFSQINKKSLEFAFCEQKLKEKLIQQL
ncbi:adenosine deaminase [Paracoccaceae bacterium]|nr:adenosine deaminase [Paracoccaceae bacterium]